MECRCPGGDGTPYPVERHPFSHWLEIGTALSLSGFFAFQVPLKSAALVLHRVPDHSQLRSSILSLANDSRTTRWNPLVFERKRDSLKSQQIPIFFEYPRRDLNPHDRKVTGF